MAATRTIDIKVSATRTKKKKKKKKKAKKKRRKEDWWYIVPADTPEDMQQSFEVLRHDTMSNSIYVLMQFLFKERGKN